MALLQRHIIGLLKGGESFYLLAIGGIYFGNFSLYLDGFYRFVLHFRQYAVQVTYGGFLIIHDQVDICHLMEGGDPILLLFRFVGGVQ